ncbi:MAG: NHL repeat-containing protein, partial [Polyangiaceae bacterium]
MPVRWPCVLAASAFFPVCAGCGSHETPPSKPAEVRPHLSTLDILAGQPGGRGWVDGQLADAHFQEPWEIAGDGAGTLYLADANLIRAIDTAKGTVRTLAGKFGLPGSSDGVGTEATFSLPSGLAFANGTLYLSDTENLILRQIDVASGAVTTIAGVRGMRGYADGAADQALLGEPEGIALDDSGHLYFADTDNNLIRMLDLSTRTITTVAGGGPTVFGLTDGVGAAAAFNKPKAMRIDAAGNLYVADALNLAVRKLVPGTGAVTTVATFPSPPQGLAIDGSDLLVSLEGTSSGSIVRVTAGGVVTTGAGSATATGFADGVGSAARFDWPAGLYEDGSGAVFIADSGNFVVRKMTIASAAVVTFAGSLSHGFADGKGRQARFAAPQGIAADDRTAYVADTGNDAIRAIDMATGVVKTLTGVAGEAGHVDGSLASARFDQPGGLAFDTAAGMLYVGDMLNRVIRQIDLGKGTVSTLAYTNGTGYMGLDGPSGLALDGANLYVVDATDDDVLAIDRDKGQISLLAGQYGTPGTADGAVDAGAGFYTPTGVAADGLGNLYVADNQSSTIRKIVAATGTV